MYKVKANSTTGAILGIAAEQTLTEQELRQIICAKGMDDISWNKALESGQAIVGMIRYVWVEDNGIDK